MKEKRGFLLRLSAAFLLFAILSSFAACGDKGYHVARLYGMGTFCAFTVEGERGADGDALPLLAPALSETEALLSHRIDGSPIDLLNGLDYTVLMDARLVGDLKLAEELKAKTGGLFSVSVLPITSLWNFDAEDPVPPSKEALAAALAEMENSALSFENTLVTKTGGDVDLGSMGKGYACDVLAEILQMRGESGLLSVGGSIAAVGKKGEALWQVGVRNPLSASANDTLGTLALTDSFVSTSGSYEKAFTYEGKAYHHILDPRTGMPAESDLLSVTVVAGKGALSDMLSTACFLVGSEAAFSLAAEYEASLVAVKTDGTLLVSASLADVFTAAMGWEVVYR